MTVKAMHCCWHGLEENHKKFWIIFLLLIQLMQMDNAIDVHGVSTDSFALRP